MEEGKGKREDVLVGVCYSLFLLMIVAISFFGLGITMWSSSLLLTKDLESM